MGYNFSNLVFEGGGVKGIAYVGAMDELAKRGIIDNVKRVGGTSAGAINAVLLGLGYSREEMRKVLWDLDFKKIMDGSFGIVRDLKRLVGEFGWYKGDFFRNWMGEIIKKKTGNANSTFAEVEKLKVTKNFKSMYFMVTNLSTGFSEIMSAEHTPNACIADAARLSMSIPFFFAAKRSLRGDVYADGGMLDNYPIKLFDREKYLASTRGGKKTDYYEAINKEFLSANPKSSPYRYNKETLGFRLDSAQEISLFRDQAEPVAHKIDDLFDFVMSVVRTYLDSQNSAHLHSDDWQRTVYIDTLGVGMTQFDISKKKKEELLEAGRVGVQRYFDWFDAKDTVAANK